jgi:hypothetical protein
MKRSISIAAAGLLALAFAAPAAAGQTSGTTSFTGQTPTSGQTLLVTATLTSNTPTVPYEYAIQNECAYPKKGSTLQNDDIVNWDQSLPDGTPQVTMPIYLQSVPTGAKCKVYLLHGNVVIKGTTTSYTVH